MSTTVPDGRNVKSAAVGLTKIVQLLDAAKAGLHDVRDYLLLLMADRHALRLFQDDLGHRDPWHAVHDTCIVGRCFDGLWRR